MKIYITQNEWKDTYDVYITEEGYKGQKLLAKPIDLVFEEFEPHSLQEPTIKISRILGRETNFLQALSDALANAGYEPKTIEENKGELKATKIHLEDMRKLVFAKEKK